MNSSEPTCRLRREVLQCGSRSEHLLRVTVDPRSVGVVFNDHLVENEKVGIVPVVVLASDMNSIPLS